MELLLISLAIALVALNAFATFRVLTCEDFEPAQKAMQVVVVWLLPLVGALLVLYHSRLRQPQVGIADPGSSQNCPGPLARNRGDESGGGE